MLFYKYGHYNVQVDPEEVLDSEIMIPKKSTFSLSDIQLNFVVVKSDVSLNGSNTRVSLN